MAKVQTVAVRVESSLQDISPEDWNRCANPGWTMAADGTLTRTGDGENVETPFNPFLTHEFLWSLEESGCATAETGWLAQHLVIDGPDDRPIGVLPCYLKNHSQGEYVFDWGWADAFERAGGRYYPKLQVSVPFTPANGRRLLTARPGDTETQNLLAMSLTELTARHGASSAHVTFLPDDEWHLLGEAGFLQRTDQQFHWFNRDYEDFDGFLADLASRKRKAVKKERRQALETGVEVEWLTGADIEERHWDAFYRFYMDTGSRKWGYPYLNRKFFSLVGERMADRILLVMARRGEKYVAGALNFIGSDALYGRHWGCIEYHPCLHFDLCYYQAIDFAISRGIDRVEAGAQGQHKLARGYVPVLTRSAHWIANRSFRDAVEHYLDNERRSVEMDREILESHAPFRKSGG